MRLFILCMVISILSFIFTKIEFSGFVGHDAPQNNIQPQSINTQIVTINELEERLTELTNQSVYPKNMAFIQAEMVDYDENIPELENILLTSDDVGERIYAISQLGQIGGHQAITVIANGLSDKNYAVRSQVIETLSEMEKNDVAHLLGQVLFNETDQELKLQAIDVLSENVSITGLSILQYFAINAIDDVIQNRAKDIMMNHAPIIEAIEKEDYYELMQQIYFLPHEEVVTNLQHILKESSDANLREEAVLELANSNEKSAIPLIEGALGDTSSDVRYHAIQFLSNIETNPLPILGQVLFSDPDPELRVEALNLIALENTPASLAFLKQALNDPDEEVREIVVHYLQLKKEEVLKE